MSKLHYILKLIIKSLHSDLGNSVSSPHCLQRLYNICCYSAFKNSKYNCITSVDGGKVKSFDLAVAANVVIKPVQRIFNECQVFHTNELKDKLTFEQVSQWSSDMYGIQNPWETPLSELQLVMVTGQYDEKTLSFFTCFVLDLPWKHSYWVQDIMAFNGYARRGAMTSIITRGVKVGKWGRDVIVINIPICKNNEENMIYLTILLPKIHYSDILSENFEPIEELWRGMEGPIELSQAYKPLELLKMKFNRVPSTGDNTLPETINYLIHGQNKQELENVKVTMPIVEQDVGRIQFTRQHFEDIGDNEAAKMFDKGRMKAFARGNPNIQLDNLVIITKTRGINLIGLGAGADCLYEGPIGNLYGVQLDIKYPFMYMIGADASNIYSIGFVNI